MGDKMIPVTEANWQNTVVELAQTLGYTHIYHTWDSRHSAAGFLDLVMVRPGDWYDSLKQRVVYLECKGTKGQPTVDQQDWIETLRDAGQEAYCFWPDQWDELVGVLR